MPDGIPPASRAPDRRQRVKALHWRRSYLLATADRLRGRIQRNETRIAEIDAALAALGVRSGGGPRIARPRLPLFRLNELPRLCLAILREAKEPMHIREITRAVLVRKGASLTDPALFEAVVERVRAVLNTYRPRGLVRMTSHRTNYVKWEAVRDGTPDREAAGS